MESNGDRWYTQPSVWYGFAGGAIAGAAVALLLAPHSGVETRRQLRRYAERQADQLRTAGASVGEWWDEVKSATAHILKRENEAETDGDGAEREREASLAGINGR